MDKFQVSRSQKEIEREEERVDALSDTFDFAEGVRYCLLWLQLR